MQSIHVNREVLLKPLQCVTGIVERKQTMPILSNVLIESHAGFISLLTTDNEIQIDAKAFIENLAPFPPFTVGAKKLQDILKSLPEGAPVRIEFSDGKVVLRSDHIRFILQTLPHSDFPVIQESGDHRGTVSLPQCDLKKLLALVQYAMAQQDIRYYLNGLLMIIEDGFVKVVATDGHRLAYACCPLDSEYERQEIILPRKTIHELYRLLGDTKDPVRISLMQNQAKFTLSDLTLISKVIDAKFPDYKRVIPSAASRTIEVERTILLQALQRTAILASDKVRSVRLVIENNNFSILCNNSEHEEAQEEFPVSYSGDKLDVSFNIAYLLDVLVSLDAKSTLFSFSDPNNSLVISIPGGDDFKYVVMPMRI